MIASLEAEQAVDQVLTARADYDRRIRFILSPEAYIEYRRFEASKPRLAQSIIRAFRCTKRDCSEPSHQQRFVSFFQRAGAYTEPLYHAPL